MMSKRDASYRIDAAYLAAFIAIVLGFVFAPDLFFGKTLLSSADDAPSLYQTGATPDSGPRRFHTIDAGAPAWQTEPWFALEHRLIFDEHEGPFWDPYDGYGAPFAGSMLAQPFYPPTIALSIDPTPTLYNWFIAVRLFIAGWFAALFMRFFVDRYAAAASGVATCLTGYYLGYNNIAHLSVDTALPMLLWSIEMIVRRQTPLRAAIAIVAVSIVYLGGMPETALIVMTVGVLYALTRLAFMHGSRLRALGALCGIQLGAMLVGGAMLVPFLEFERLSYNDHDPLTGGRLLGVDHDIGWSKFFATELVPLAYGFPWVPNLPQDSFSGMRGFFGCAVLVLAVIAIVAFIKNRAARNVVVPFFFAVAAYCIMKRFGNPLVNWTGALPLFNLIGFAKYLEFALGDSMAILAGFGVAAIRRRLVTKNDVTIAATGVLMFVTLLFAWNEDLPVGPHAWYFPAAFSIGLIALISTAALAYVSIALPPEQTRIISGCFALIILGEISAAYAIPQFWTLTASATHDPYTGAPFTRFLDAHMDRNEERTFGVLGPLFPDWPSAYGFADPRALNALYPAEYLPFVRAFLSNSPVSGDDEFDRFTAMRPIALDSPFVRRWFRLSSIAWLIAPTPLNVMSEPAGGFLEDLWHQAAPSIPVDKTPSVFVKAVSLNGISENVLFEHPPFDVTYSTNVPKGAPVVRADLALDPASYATGPICGGPVTFTIRALQGGRVVRSASDTIDPKHVLAERRWIPLLVDLHSFAGQPIALQFETAATDFCYAWAVWGEPRFTIAGDAHPTPQKAAFSRVFASPGAYVYRIPDAFPRLRLVHQAIVLPAKADELTAITATTFDAGGTAVVDRPIPALSPAGPGDHVRVLSARANEITVDVESGGTSLLVQNDTYYPGWVATVDGSPTPIVRADYLFRGIVVPGGHHLVTIAYRSNAVALGVVLSSIGIAIVLALTAWGLISEQRQRARSFQTAAAPAAR